MILFTGLNLFRNQSGRVESLTMVSWIMTIEESIPKTGDILMKLVFVCTGNTCRSPMAEHMLKNRLTEDEREQLDVTSAGVAASDGQPPAQPAVAVMKEEGVDSLALHSSTPIENIDLEEGDLVLTMTPAHESRFPPDLESQGVRVDVLKEFVGRSGGISDPFGGDVNRYRQLRQELGAIIDEVYERLHDEDVFSSGS